MATNVLMPALSPTMEQGKLSKWVKKVGDQVKSGDVLAEIETDKATMEVEAVDEGTLGAILIEEGTDNVAVNTPIGVIVAEGESADAAPAPAAGKAPASAAAPAGAEPGAPDLEGKPKAPGQPGPGPTADAADHALGAGAPAAEAPEVPAGTKMVTMTVREALRDAMAEEMRREPKVFIMGEEVAEYQGAYKVTQGLLQEFGAKRVIDTPITEHGFAGICVGAVHGGPEAHRGVHDLQLRHAGDRPHHQLRRQDALHVGRADGVAHRVPRPQRRGRPRRRPAQPGLHRLVFLRARPQGRGALLGGRRQGPAQERHPRPQPGRVPRERDPLRPELRRAGARRLHGADRQGQGGPPRQGRDDRRLVDRHVLRAEGRRGARQGGHRRRGDRPAHHPADGHRDGAGLRQEDPPLRDGRGGLGAVGRRRRDRGPPHGTRLRRARRARDAGVAARTCPCPMPPTSRSWRCRPSPTSSRRSRPSPTGELPARRVPPGSRQAPRGPAAPSDPQQPGCLAFRPRPPCPPTS